MKTQLILVTVIALMLGACGKKDNKSSTRINRQAGNALATGTTTCNTSTFGKIYDNQIDDVSFRQKVADFSLRNLDEIGNISGQLNSPYGINFQMTLNFSGGRLAQNSQVMITIFDSIALNENGGYLQFQLNGMEGQGANGQFNVVVGDQKGYLRLEGSRQNQGIYGRAYYNNYNQGERPIGEFQVANCAVVGI